MKREGCILGIRAATTYRLVLTAACAGVGALVILSSSDVQAQASESRIWQGIYTAAQAERGKATFNTTCIRCHGGDLAGTTAPALKGDRFFSSWGGGPVEQLFLKIRDFMPPSFGTILDAQTKLDIATYILETNGFPPGQAELTLAGDDLATAQILRKDEQASVQNFSLIQTVGCLARGPNNTWVLTQTAEPRTTRDDTPTVQGLAAAASQPLGTRTYRLLSVVPFNPESHRGQKMEARGLVYTEPGDERITLTSLQMAGAGCGE